MSSQSGKNESSSDSPFSRKGRFRILGFDKQDFIKAFFGGNSLLAIVVLGLICLFLGKEAVGFFPKHHEGLVLYRQSGQEYVSYLEKQFESQKTIYALADQAYQMERKRVGGEDLEMIKNFKRVLGLVEDETEDSCDAFLDARDEYVDVLEEYEDSENQAELKPELDELKLAADQAEKEWLAAVQRVLEGANREKLAPGASDASWAKIKELLMQFDPEEADFPYIDDLEASIEEKVGPLKEVRALLQKNEKPIKDLWLKLRKPAADTKAKGVAFQTAPERKEALEKGLAIAKTEEKKADLQKQIDEIKIIEPDYKKLLEPIYASKEKLQEVSVQLVQGLNAVRGQLPEPSTISDADARDRIESLRGELPSVTKKIQRLSEKAKDWKHDESYSWGRSVAAFFFGRDWITNSSWHDFYGVLPLFTGSLVISVIAIIFAVPFAIGAAIYVNQIASPAEQNVIKPAIEFIQAIPSVVLGFFGIVILGETLRSVSGWEALSWIPGFPMQERLNMLNAGLLLGLMAIPTVFTLAEDAINNVPRSFRDASYALGATRLQTVLRVIVPTAFSGIIAAILLGFGRVVGETMVVLLVAGNKIAIPDFAAGIGVITQPAHTMTGIIAQETGEVDKGSLHWRALFMVGLLLFLISLTINYFSQRIIRKFSLPS